MTEVEIPGSGERSTEKRYYWNIQSGKWAMSYGVTEHTPGQVPRTNKNGKVVHEIYKDFLSGTLYDVNINEKVFDGKKSKELVIKLKPKDGVMHVLNISAASRYFGSFCEKLPHLSSGMQLTLSPYSFTDAKTGKDNKGVTVVFENEKIKSYYKSSEGGQIVLSHNFPPMSKTWDKMSEAERKIYFITVDAFFEEEIAKWRTANAPDYKKPYEMDETTSVTNDASPAYDTSNANVPVENDLPF